MKNGFSRRAMIAGGSAAIGVLAAGGALAQAPLRIEVSDGVIEPMPIALPRFLSGAGAHDAGALVRSIVAADLESTGMFRIIDPAAYLEGAMPVSRRPSFNSWRAINAEALGVGEAGVENGRYRIAFRLWDVFGGGPAGEGLGMRAGDQDLRRIGHKIADAVYETLTGEPGCFDTRIAFVSETGPKTARVKRIAVMDQDGAGFQHLTDGSQLTLTPRFAPTGDRMVYISWDTGVPKALLHDLRTGRREILGQFPGMSFAPRFSPDGRSVIMSLSEGGSTDIYAMDLATRRLGRLTSGAQIDTAPSYSPDGGKVVFESDAAGGQQIYVMSATGAAPRRISFGSGRYGTPVWSPRGDQIAFTKMEGGRFHVGVMRSDGSGERLLTSSFLDEAPTWSPNGRELMFFRENPGTNSSPRLWRVDATGRNLRQVGTPGGASDPSWSPRLA